MGRQQVCRPLLGNPEAPKGSSGLPGHLPAPTLALHHLPCLSPQDQRLSSTGSGRSSHRTAKAEECLALGRRTRPSDVLKSVNKIRCGPEELSVTLILHCAFPEVAEASSTSDHSHKPSSICTIPCSNQNTSSATPKLPTVTHSCLPVVGPFSAQMLPHREVLVGHLSHQ